MTVDGPSRRWSLVSSVTHHARRTRTTAVMRYREKCSGHSTPTHPRVAKRSGLVCMSASLPDLSHGNTVAMPRRKALIYRAQTPAQLLVVLATWIFGVANLLQGRKHPFSAGLAPTPAVAAHATACRWCNCAKLGKAAPAVATHSVCIAPGSVR